MWPCLMKWDWSRADGLIIQENTMRRATKEESATWWQERRANKHLVIQEGVTIKHLNWKLATALSGKGLNPNSTWLKQKRDLAISGSKQVEIQIEAESFQVWMNPGELTEGRVTSKAWGRGFSPLSVLCCSPGFLLGHTSPWVTVKWPSVAGSPHTIHSGYAQREEKSSLQLASGLTLTGVAWAFCLLGLIPSSSRCRQPWLSVIPRVREMCIHLAL